MPDHSVATAMRSISDQIKGRWLRSILSGVGLILGCWQAATAHEGPPYPIIVDQTAGPYLVSVWADPDVGIGTFFVILEPAGGGTLPERTAVRLGVQPVSGRLAETFHAAERQGVRGRVQYKAEIPFDMQEFWRVRVILENPEGAEEVSTDVEVTPPGYGRWDLLIYVFPFVAVGLLWLRAVLQRRSRTRHPAITPESRSPR